VSFQEPSAGPASTMMNTKVIYDDIKAEFDGCDAGPGDVLSGTTFFSTDTSAWGAQTGTASAGAAGLPKTGQFISYTDYDDAYYANPAGADIGNPQVLGTWSAYTADGGRFTLQTVGSDVVVTDNATGLIWASDGNGDGCNGGATITWAAAITWADGLDFAGHTDWRLPNYHELPSIVDSSKSDTAIDTNFFPNTQSDFYWSSTTSAGSTGDAWYVSFYAGSVYLNPKIYNNYVRAVRGGE